ncbi:hypothetical protein V6N13_138952 [Hibiscus sabdariffa]|uniref:BHLH domain-containing protein n=1 Tax=Hibiscus sabdariffa TaxID=183260 RepID=A0ABR2PKP6_9ROSI
MADLYGDAPYSNPEPEEISTILNQLLHNPSSSRMQFKGKTIHSLPTEVPGSSMPASNSGVGMAIPVVDRHQLGGFALRAESEPLVNFSDPETYFGANVKDNADNALSSAGDFSYDSEVPDSSEVPSNQERPRSSSKRSRAAEVHNLSEKRRRSRINEKMKALQNLIPNSNKTDKASMLDEAIEYLKELQLQVQEAEGCCFSPSPSPPLHFSYFSSSTFPLIESELSSKYYQQSAIDFGKIIRDTIT